LGAPHPEQASVAQPHATREHAAMKVNHLHLMLLDDGGFEVGA